MSSFICRPGRCTRNHARGDRYPIVLIQVLEQRTLLSSAPVIDVMVLYTPKALADAGNIAALDNRVHRAIADTNLALANSRVNASIRLVHEGEINYTETGVLNTDLDNLQSGVGVLGTVGALRDRYGADLVSLWVGKGDEGGRAFQPGDSTLPQPGDGYNVVQETYAVDNYVFAHEIGHNLGAGHDRSDPTPRAIPYAYGKTFTLGSYTVGDIMSATDRIPYYSNPNVSFRGVPTGNADNSAQPADNARAMNQFAQIVANYRSTEVPDTSAPAAALDAVVANPAAHTLSVKVQYADDTTVSVGGLGTGDIRVTGPNGFRQVANFQGLDFPSNGSQRVATYQVSVAGYSNDPNDYRFTLQPNRLRDVYGHTNPGGVLGAPGDLWPNRAGPRLTTAFDAGTLNGTTWRFNNWIGADNPTAFYRFTLSAPTQFTANLMGLTGNIDELLVQDRNGDGQIQSGEILSYPRRSGTSPESISMSLAAGTYELWVSPPGTGVGSSYSLTMSALSPPPPPQTFAAGGSISGAVFNDVNANGSRDSGESGVSGWRVYADLNNNNHLDPGEPATWTDGSGNYRLSGLAAGFYIVRAAPQAGWSQVAPINNWGRHVTLAPSQIVAGQNFAEARQGLVSGSVFNDANGDGIRQAGDFGLVGWRVFLDSNNDGIWQSGEQSTLTDSSGNWSFGNLTPGSYTIDIVQQQNWKLTTPSIYRISVPSGGGVGGMLFGEKWV